MFFSERWREHIAVAIQIQVQTATEVRVCDSIITVHIACVLSILSICTIQCRSFEVVYGFKHFGYFMKRL